MPDSIPTPTLGDVSAISIPTTDLDNSLRFYQRLGFTELFRADMPFPWIQITDGAVLIMLRKNAGPFMSLTYFAKELEKIAADLEQKGIVLSQFTSPYPWAIATDGLTVIGLHQTEDFNYPVITYFAADMQDKIARLKEAGLTDYTEKGRASIVVNTPEGQHINLFKMGM